MGGGGETFWKYCVKTRVNVFGKKTPFITYDMLCEVVHKEEQPVSVSFLYEEEPPPPRSTPWEAYK